MRSSLQARPSLQARAQSNPKKTRTRMRSVSKFCETSSSFLSREWDWMLKFWLLSTRHWPFPRQDKRSYNSSWIWWQNWRRKNWMKHPGQQLQQQPQHLLQLPHLLFWVRQDVNSESNFGVNYYINNDATSWSLTRFFVLMFYCVLRIIHLNF